MSHFRFVSIFSIAPAFGQAAPAPAFGSSPAPATGGLFGSSPGTIFAVCFDFL
jgi:hypothetical protein